MQDAQGDAKIQDDLPRNVYSPFCLLIHFQRTLHDQQNGGDLIFLKNAQPFA
jgi:hypothetical protein